MTNLNNECNHRSPGDSPFDESRIRIQPEGPRAIQTYFGATHKSLKLRLEHINPGSSYIEMCPLCGMWYKDSLNQEDK